MGACRSDLARTWSAATRRPARLARQATRKTRRAVEKAARWSPWKPRTRFPTVPTAPWKSRRAGIPTFPPLRRRVPFYQIKSENPLRQAEEGSGAWQAKPDRSRVNQTGQIDLLRTAEVPRRVRAPCEAEGIRR